MNAPIDFNQLAVAVVDEIERRRPRSYRFLRIRKVEKKTGLNASVIYRKEAAGEFPRRCAITESTSGWLEHEVDAWIAERAAARDEIASRVTPRERVLSKLREGT